MVGLINPIIARREDKIVIGGHQRLLAARKLGLKQVPVVLVDLSEQRAHLLNLALNRISVTWDQELLARLLANLNAVPNIDLSLSGFSEDELQKHLKSLESREKRERLETFDMDDALEAARAAPVASTGDIWLLGEHRIMCGDSIGGEDVKRLMNGNKANMAITDPPYNVSYGSHGGAPENDRRRSILNDDIGEGFYDFLLVACQNILSHTDGAVYIFMAPHGRADRAGRRRGEANPEEAVAGADQPGSTKGLQGRAVSVFPPQAGQRQTPLREPVLVDPVAPFEQGIAIPAKGAVIGAANAVEPD